MRNWRNAMVSSTKNLRLCQAKLTSSNNESGWLSTKNWSKICPPMKRFALWIEFIPLTMYNQPMVGSKKELGRRSPPIVADLGSIYLASSMWSSIEFWFFQKIESAYPRKKKVHIFCDNAGYYKNKAATEYLRTSKIKLHFLPPYSPNLNSIERWWKWVKERVIYNAYYREFEDFKSAVFGFFATISALAADSILGQDFRSRERDTFRPVGI